MEEQERFQTVVLKCTVYGFLYIYLRSGVRQMGILAVRPQDHRFFITNPLAMDYTAALT